MITSAQNPKVQRVRALLGRTHTAQRRAQTDAFVVEGVRLLEEALACGWQADLVLYSEQLSARGRAALDILRGQRVEVEEIPEHLLHALSNTETSQGVLAVFNSRSLPWPVKADFLLVVDGVRDPGNLGTLLRTAWAAGVQGVILAPGCVDAFSPKVLRAGMGAQFRLPVERRTWEQIREIAHSLNFYLAETEQAVPCWDADLHSPLALIIGGEAEGAGSQARSLARANLAIPMPGGSESLNAAVAAGILIFEVVRQRRLRGAG